MTLAGRPMIEWSLLAAAAAETIVAAVIAAPPGGEEQARRSLEAAKLEGVVVTGGLTRAESVRRALAATETDLVAVHDAARPLVSAVTFDAVVGHLAAADTVDAAVAAAPINDTVKRGAEARPAAGPPEPVVVAATLHREQLWTAQTPQAFRAAVLHSAQQRAAAAGELEAATDEAALIEAAGGVVVLVPAPSRNLKVTTFEDLATAEALLAAVGRV